jgi:hypothetical protein
MTLLPTNRTTRIATWAIRAIEHRDVQAAVVRITVLLTSGYRRRVVRDGPITRCIATVRGRA